MLGFVDKMSLVSLLMLLVKLTAFFVRNPGNLSMGTVCFLRLSIFVVEMVVHWG